MRLILCILLCLGWFGIVAQSPNFNVSFPSPNAASLGLYGEVPVSLHNGVANISIPMYEIKEGPIKMPVSLTYHASGVRPDVHPGWVGNGWALNCGGMITRVVKGTPDEAYFQQDLVFFDSHNTPASRAFNVGHYFNNHLQDNSWATSSRIEYLAKRGTEYGASSDFYQETEPDEFVFNFNGVSGKFVFDENHNIRVLSHPEIKVEMEDTLMVVGYASGSIDFGGGNIKPFTYVKNNLISTIGGMVYELEVKIRGFKITTPDGIEYEFGMWNMGQIASNVPIEASIDFFQQVYCYENWDTWYLKRIKAPTGHIINLEYGVPAPDNKRWPVASFGRTVAMEKSSGSSTPSGIFSIFGPVKASSTSIRDYFNGRIIYPAYVTKVTTSKEQIDFSLSNTTELSYLYGDILNNLVIQSSAYDPNMTAYLTARAAIGFQGSNPYEEYLDFSALKWKKLDKLVIKNAATGEAIKQWDFSYTNDPAKRLTLLGLQEKGKANASPQSWVFDYNQTSLPNYNVFQTDHWGFYNGKTPVWGDLSDSYLSAFYSTKNTDPAYLKAGILEKITYPTGGYTTFEYEPNQYNSVVVRDYNTGAFSLQNVSPAYAGGLRISTIKNYESAGVLATSKNYSYSGGILSGDAQYFWKNYTGKLLNGNTYVSDRFVSQTMLPVSTNSVGSHIGYSKVTETFSGNGRAEYYYRNYDILDENFLATIDVQKSKYSPFTSHDFERGLLFKKIVYNEAGNMLQQEETVFPSPAAAYLRATSTKQVPVLGGYSIEGSSYKVYTAPFQASASKAIQHSQYDASKTITTTNNFIYDGIYGLLKEVTSANSKKESKLTSYKYSFDMTGSNDPQGVYLAMKNRNILSPIVEQAVSVNGNFSHSSKTNYRNWGNNILAPETVEIREENDPAAEVRLRYWAYDEKGNVLSGAKEQDMRKSYIWAYSKNYPVAEVLNAKENEVYFGSFEEGGWDNQMTVYDRAQHRTGNYSGRIDNPAASEKVSHSNTTLAVSLTGITKYKFSGWVYSDGPAAEIFLFMKRAGETGYFTYVTNVQTTEKNKWVYLEKVYDVPADVTQLNIRVDNNGGGSVWFDDIRLHPAAAQMTTYTYDPLIGMTSQCDVNNRVTSYAYDDFGRLALVRDNEGNVVKRICYNTQGQPQENCAISVNAVWQVTGLKRCAKNPDQTNTGIEEQQEVDNNPFSATYNQMRWAAIGQNCAVCQTPANWVNTANTKCELYDDPQRSNTGWLLQEQVDANSCSGTYNVKRWVRTGCSSGCPNPVPDWAFTGNSRCQKDASGNNTGLIEKELIDLNQCSPLYNTYRWFPDVYSCATCATPTTAPNWQATGNTRCKKTGSNYNTGEVESEQKDMNPCSSGFNTTRWVVTGRDCNGCPITNCTGEGYKIINCNCEYGTRSVKSSTYGKYNGVFQYKCVYFYCFSDFSVTPDYIMYSPSPCAVGGPCLE